MKGCFLFLWMGGSTVGADGVAEGRPYGSTVEAVWFVSDSDSDSSAEAMGWDGAGSEHRYRLPFGWLIPFAPAAKGNKWCGNVTVTGLDTTPASRVAASGHGQPPLPSEPLQSRRARPVPSPVPSRNNVFECVIGNSRPASLGAIHHQMIFRSSSHFAQVSVVDAASVYVARRFRSGPFSKGGRWPSGARVSGRGKGKGSSRGKGGKRGRRGRRGIAFRTAAA